MDGLCAKMADTERIAKLVRARSAPALIVTVSYDGLATSKLSCNSGPSITIYTGCSYEETPRLYITERRHQDDPFTRRFNHALIFTIGSAGHVRATLLWYTDLQLDGVTGVMGLTMPNEPTFWPRRGGPYSLQIDLGAPSDAIAALALKTIWEHTSLSGPYQFSDRAPGDQPVWAGAPFQVTEVYYGVLLLTDQARVPCQVVVQRLGGGVGSHGPTRLDPFDSPTGSARSLLIRENEPSDILNCWLSMEALGLVYPVGGYPFGDLDAAAAWRPELDSVLVSIARHLHGHLPFRRGGVGFDLSLASKQHPTHPLADGLLIEEEGALQWHPPKNYAL